MASPWVYIIEAILAIFLPPLVALMQRGCSLDFLINIIFTLFGWIPGIIHAWYLLLVDYDNEKKGVTNAPATSGMTNTTTAQNPVVADKQVPIEPPVNQATTTTTTSSAAPDVV